MAAQAPGRAASRRTLFAFGAVSFACFAYAGLFGTCAPLWFQRLGYSALAIGALAIGTLASLQSATRLFSPFAWAWLADHSGRRPQLPRIAVASALLCATGCFVSPAYGWVAGVTVALFVCTAGVIPISEAALAHFVRVGGRWMRRATAPRARVGFDRFHRRCRRQRCAAARGRHAPVSVARDGAAGGAAGRRGPPADARGGVSTLRFAAIAGSGSIPALLVQCTHALTVAAQHSSCIAVVNRHFPGRLRGRDGALYTLIGYGASGVIGGVAGGAVRRAWGFPAVFCSASGAAAIAVACSARAGMLDRQTGLMVA